MSRIAIVGGGVAGLRAAERLRELDYPGEVVIFSTETVGPYHRPMLSKQFLAGGVRPDKLRLDPLDDLDAVWRLGTPVSGVDTGRRLLHLPGGEELGYDGLIIASGADARRMNGGQHGHPRVVTIRALSDTRQLQRALTGNRLPVVVLGAGFTGCEVAASLRGLNREVVLVSTGQALMAQLLGADLGGTLTALHRHHGVDIELGATISSWYLRNRHSVTIRLSSGREVEAACVVVAVGSVPTVEWLRGSGLRIDKGVLCDPTCHAVGAEDVVAAGDVARWPNPRFDEQPRRVAHWTNAVEMGRAAAESLLRGRSAAQPFTPIPRFWSEQYGTHIQAAGLPELGDRHVRLDTRARADRPVTGFVRGRQVMGIVGFDSSADVLAYAGEMLSSRPEADSGDGVERNPHRRVSFLQRS